MSKYSHHNSYSPVISINLEDLENWISHSLTLVDFGQSSGALW